MKIVTGFRGENHITSNDDQGRNQGIFGTGSYVLPVRSRFQSTLVSANELQIGDGEGVMQGVHFRTEPTSTDSITIENGSQGMKRIDLVCVRYEKAPETNIENVSWVIHTGEPSESNPQTPSYTQGDILAGDTIAEMPMYKINLDGITVTSVQPQFEILTSAEGLIELLGDSNISGIGDGTVTGALASLNTDLAKSVMKKKYISNSYVSQKAFNRCECFKIGKLGYVFRINLTIDETAIPSGTLDVPIGSFDGVTTNQVLQTIASQIDVGTIFLTITQDGTVKISNLSGQAARSWYRANIFTC